MTAQTPSRVPPRWRRIVGSIVLAVGIILAPVALLANWAVLELSDTDYFVQTFAPLADEPAVQHLVATQVTSVITDQIDVPAITAPLFDGLTHNLSPLAGAAVGSLQGLVTSGVEQVIGSTVTQVVESEAFSAVWEKALRVTHSQLIGALAGDPNTPLTIDDAGAVGIQLGPIVTTVQQELVDRGIPFAENIPTVDRTVVLFQSQSLADVKRAYAVSHAVGAWLPWLVLALLVGGVLLLGASVRSIVGASAGVALVMVLMIVGLTLGRSLVIANLASAEIGGNVARAVFAHVLGGVYSSAIAFALLGLAIAVSVWLIRRYEVVALVRARIGSRTPE